MTADPPGPPPPGSPPPGGGARDGHPVPASATRADRRRRQRRRSSVIAITVAAVIGVVAIVGVLLLLTRTDDPDTKPTASRSTSTTSTAPSTTTTAATLPVATTAVPRSSNPVVALAQQYDGRYVGTFSNTTADTTGPASLELRIDPATDNMAIDADFDGDLFGGGAKETRRISGTIALSDPNAAVTTQTKAFGPVTGQLDSSLALVLTAADVPDAKVKGFQLTGRLRTDNTGFDATFTVTYENGSSAAGTVTLNCDPAGARGSEVSTICSLSAPAP